MLFAKLKLTSHRNHDSNLSGIPWKISPDLHRLVEYAWGVIRDGIFPDRLFPVTPLRL